MNKVVSVVVTHNRSKLLRECILALSHSNVSTDIIIIDNASTDDTKNIVNDLLVENRNIMYFNTQKNIGGSGGFNYGIRKAYEMEYDYFWIMDDDTIVKPDSLMRLLEIKDSVGNDFGWISSLALWTDGKECVMNWHTVDKKWNRDKKGLLEGRLLCECSTFVSLLINRNAVCNCGLPIKDYFIWGDDTEYTMRISQKFPCYFAFKSQVIHKMKSNEGTVGFEDVEDPSRIERMFYSIRNDFCTFRMQGIIKTLRFIYGMAGIFMRVIRTTKSYRGKKIKIILKGMWCGLWFHPPIEYIE